MRSRNSRMPFKVRPSVGDRLYKPPVRLQAHEIHRPRAARRALPAACDSFVSMLIFGAPPTRDAWPPPCANDRCRAGYSWNAARTSAASTATYEHRVEDMTQDNQDNFVDEALLNRVKTWRNYFAAKVGF